VTEGPESPEESSADILTDRDAVSNPRRLRVVVTGSSGFIGSHICEEFLARGCDVVGVDDGSSGVDYAPDGVDRTDLDVIDLVPEDLAGADLVVHAAAYADVRGNWEGADGGLSARARLVENNIVATAHLLEAIPPTATVVLLSTAAMYGSDRGLMSERDERVEHILSPYAASKLSAEALLAAYARRKGNRWFALRLVNVVGARTHHGVVSDFVRQMRTYGRISALDNGAQVKSWVHVLDVVGAIGALFDRLDAPSGVYNVSSADLVSWWDIVDAMGVDRTTVLYPPSRRAGHLGDPVDLRVSSRKLYPFYRCERHVRAGIRDALVTLGWREST
jgi:UDP-glucose 4-epimerase